MASREEVRSAPSAEERVRRLYLHVFSRPPTERETEAGLRFIEFSSQKEEPSSSKNAGGSEASAWKYGYAPYDAGSASHQLDAFALFPFHSGKSLQGDSEFPDKKNGFGWSKLTAQGGHAGNSRYCVVRRWTSPVAGTIRLAGLLRHRSEPGDGVRASIYGPDGKILATWSAHNAEADTTVESVAIERGEPIDFVVDCQGSGNYDSFEWAPLVVLASGDDKSGDVAGSWSSKRDFAHAAIAGEKTERRRRKESLACQSQCMGALRPCADDVERVCVYSVAINSDRQTMIS